MAIKLLLIEDVEDLGRSGDIVSVKPGFARNFLIPQGLALVADPKSIKLQDKLKEERAKRADVEREEAEDTKKRLDGSILSIIVKVDQEGHLYGSVSGLEISRLIKENFGIELDKKAIQLKHPLKQTGVHEIPIKLKEGITSSVTLKVLSEEAKVG